VRKIEDFSGEGVEHLGALRSGAGCGVSSDASLGFGALCSFSTAL
jgi:hypothetical protein